MKNFIWVVSPLLLSLGLAVGCDGGGDDDGTGGTGTGGTSTGGTGTGGTGTGGVGTGGVSTGGTSTGGQGEGGLGGFGGFGGAAAEVVALCEASLEDIDGCDSGRECNYEIAHTYCSLGNAAATLGMSACFQLGQGCHTPADPGNQQVETCFEAVLAAEGTDLSVELRAEADSKCDDDDYQPLMLEVFAVMAGDEIAAGFSTCVEAAVDCTDIDECITDNLGLPLPGSCG